MTKLLKQAPEDLDLIRNQLYHGAYRDLAEITGYSYPYIIDVIQLGRRRNDAIVQAARDLIKAHRDMMAQLTLQNQEA